MKLNSSLYLPLLKWSVAYPRIFYGPLVESRYFSLEEPLIVNHNAVSTHNNINKTISK